MASHGPASSALNEPVVSQCNTALQPAMSPCRRVFVNLKFWCVGGAAVVVPWLVRGIPAVQSGCGSGVGRVRPWCFPNQNLSAELD